MGSAIIILVLKCPCMFTSQSYSLSFIASKLNVLPTSDFVNGTDLAEIHGGEVAITNLHSCNGPEFVLQVHFSQDVVGTSGPGVRASKDANARLKFVYFPIVEGKESIDSILEKLEAEGCGIAENFENFSHVSIRRLGRLLPDARWYDSTRAFVVADTDAGFNPTPSKTNLAHHHPYTTALKNFGDKPLEKDKEVKIKIYKDGKQVTLLQLEQQYQEWIFQMHNRYDEEIDHGEDQPLLVVSPSNKKKLGISADAYPYHTALELVAYHISVPIPHTEMIHVPDNVVVRVHKELRRKGAPWKSGQKIKVLKGACAGCHKNNVYATLEYILLEGFEGDAGATDLHSGTIHGLFFSKDKSNLLFLSFFIGEARLICRPLSLASENGCSLAVDDGNAAIDMRSSLSLPISVIDSGKCLAIENAEWEYQVEKLHQKMPTTIEILSARDCQELEIEGALPTDSAVYAGHAPPKKIVAVVRPASFNSASASKNLDQKHIVKEHLEMSIKIKFRDDDKSVLDVQHVYSGLTTPSSHKGLHGLYIFPLGCKFPSVFQKAGVYTFSLSIVGLNLKSCERTVKVKALSEVGSWRQLSDGQSLPYNVRVGSCFPPFSIACYDIYGNRTAFASVPEVMIKILSGGGVIANVHGMTLDLSSDKLTLKIKNTLIESNELDKIRPNYEATLVVSPQDELFIVSIPCQVVPGSLQRITTQPRNLDKQLLPGHAVKELVLEADKLRHRVHQKVTGQRKNMKSSGTKHERPNGTSWAFEVGSDLQVCPIVVEDLEYPGHMLIEMLCNDNGLFLEIAETDMFRTSRVYRRSRGTGNQQREDFGGAGPNLMVLLQILKGEREREREERLCCPDLKVFLGFHSLLSIFSHFSSPRKCRAAEETVDAALAATAAAAVEDARITQT
ncbi:hypothetical protein TEA_027988 [Camellia sinensis var. sinensis]|uniref:Uncharacterized protein n=1 Tax=Camellia sinensis var. sinensis TaxID=542762 RepID=A0A4S4E2P4_CAMSN|nr:hypothetical protein TEA_027988 [Camellia sinensis var. sinensis]